MRRLCTDRSTRNTITSHITSSQTVFLIDHLWCTTLLQARKQLEDHPVVRRNLQVVLGIGETLCGEECVGPDIGSPLLMHVHKPDEESESDADADDEDEGEAGFEEGSAPAPPPDAADARDDEEDMRARLLAFLGVDDEAEAAATTEVDLDGVVDQPVDAGFVSYILRALPLLFPHVEALSLQSMGLGAARAAEVGFEGLGRLESLARG